MNIKSIVTTGIFIGVHLAGGALAQTWAPPAEIAPTKPSVQAAPPTAAPSVHPAIGARQRSAARLVASPRGNLDRGVAPILRGVTRRLPLI